MGFVIGAIVAVGLVWAFAVYRQNAIDRGLDQELHAAVMEARRTLSPDELAALRQQGIELEDIGRSHARAGNISPKEAARTTKRAIIQSTYASLEVNRMFAAGSDRQSSIIFD